MSVFALRRAVLPQGTAWRNVLVTLVAVAAIVAGLLAMHSLNLDAEHAAVNTAAMAASDGHHVDAGTASGESRDPAAACPGPCEPGHSMGMMACILALLVSVVAFAAHQVARRWAAVTRWLGASLAHSVALAPPSPPSLHALSISRT